MAKIEQGILGAFSGKVGGVVGYVWRGRQVVRAYRREINYPDTESQRAERAWFVGMVRFAATARPALLLGLRERAARWQMTEGNAFVRMNKGCFGRGRMETIEAIDSIETIDSMDFIDYQGIRVSEGSAAAVRFTTAVVDGDGVLRVSFEKKGGLTRARGCDRVYVYVYNTGTREGLLSAPAERRSGRLSVRLPDGWNQQNVRLWGFVVDGEGRASNSAYIGWDAGEEEPRNGEKTGGNHTKEEEKTGKVQSAEEKIRTRNLLISPPPYEISLKNENFSLWNE